MTSGPIDRTPGTPGSDKNHWGYEDEKFWKVAWGLGWIILFQELFKCCIIVLCWVYHKKFDQFLWFCKLWFQWNWRNIFLCVWSSVIHPSWFLFILIDCPTQLIWPTDRLHKRILPHSSKTNSFCPHTRQIYMEYNPLILRRGTHWPKWLFFIFSFKFLCYS